MQNSFRRLVRKAIANPHLQSALDGNAERRMAAQSQVFDLLQDSDELRLRARRIRESVLNDHIRYCDEFSAQVAANGVHVHHAKDASAATQIVIDIVRQHDVNLIAKSKTMLSEEIDLNSTLHERGIRVVETDLGEFIVQLRGEAPSHIITPAVHLRKEDVAETFAEKLNMPYSDSVEDMVVAARHTLREVFQTAGIGISGVNFGVAENGVLCLVTNEGNGRMVSTLPPIYIALMGVERIVPTMEDLGVLLQLLTRSATGQKITSYVSLIHQPRQAEDIDGPNKCHLILVDNGRTAVIDTPFVESLCCIRCGACLNVCPVFREIGGHTYQSVYPGPIGSVISPVLFGMKDYGHLAMASTLCGACRDACPVKIDLPKLLLRVRHEYRAAKWRSPLLRWAMSVYSWVMDSPVRLQYVQAVVSRLTGLLAGRDGWLKKLPPPLSRWSRDRDFPPFASHPFRQRFYGLSHVADESVYVPTAKEDQHRAVAHPGESKDIIQVFQQELEALDGEFIHCTLEQVGTVVAQKIQDLGVRTVMIARDETFPPGFIQNLMDANISLQEVNLPRTINPDDTRFTDLDHVEVGVTTAVAGIAETGTIVLNSGSDRSQLASLLPPVHVAVLSANAIVSSQREWFADEAADLTARSSRVTLVSGPSRTADIEMTLTVGVHGPGRLIVVCYQ
jgi:L-lactate dehydrogenase complex protein LldF